MNADECSAAQRLWKAGWLAASWSGGSSVDVAMNVLLQSMHNCLKYH